MIPVEDARESKVDGLVFLGVSLSRKSAQGHPESVTHQTTFDFNSFIDRDYEFVSSTGDDGWLVGGGEPGIPKSFKLPAKDSAHIELMRIGTFCPELGGICEKDIIDVLCSGQIMIPQIEVLPTGVATNGDSPPDLDIRFDMPFAPDFSEYRAPLPANWQLPFIQNQLFKHFSDPKHFNPGPFHMTLAHRVKFRSHDHGDAFFAKMDALLKRWVLHGPRPLNDGAWDVDGKPLEQIGAYNSGIWLFENRTKITKFFAPNFLPPYDTKEKREIILSFLTEEWDHKSHAWKQSDFKTQGADESAGPSQLFDSLCRGPIDACHVKFDDLIFSK